MITWCYNPQGYKALHAVLHGTDHTIKFKRQCLHESLISSLFTRKIIVYLQQVRQASGLSPSLTLYAFRRQFGTTVERAMREHTAQYNTNHGVGSTTYRKYYDRS